MPIFRKLNHFLKLAVVAAIIPLGSGASAQEPAFSLSSPDLTNGQFETPFIANGFGCTGGNISPELVWRHVPAGTQSLALTVHDPDAPTGQRLLALGRVQPATNLNGFATGRR